MLRVAALALMLAAATNAAPARSQAVDEPSDYRMEDYRGPVPATLAGGTVVGPEEAYELWQAGGVAFIDVLPRPPKPENLPEGTIWRSPKRLSIPGAMWLPNVGYGALADVNHDYFRKGLSAATGGKQDHPVLFFCLIDCWMSWNAAKRALEYGYTDVYWLPEGTDGWELFDYPMDEIKPVPGGK